MYLKVSILKACKTLDAMYTQKHYLRVYGLGLSEQQYIVFQGKKCHTVSSSTLGCWWISVVYLKKSRANQSNSTIKPDKTIHRSVVRFQSRGIEIEWFNVVIVILNHRKRSQRRAPCRFSVRSTIFRPSTIRRDQRIEWTVLLPVT